AGKEGATRTQWCRSAGGERRRSMLPVAYSVRSDSGVLPGSYGRHSLTMDLGALSVPPELYGSWSPVVYGGCARSTGWRSPQLDDCALECWGARLNSSQLLWGPVKKTMLGRHGSGFLVCLTQIPVAASRDGDTRKPSSGGSGRCWITSNERTGCHGCQV